MEIFEEFISQENDMEKTLEEKKELAAKVIAALKKEYPDADCTLDYNEAWKLLVSVRLAASVLTPESTLWSRSSIKSFRM